MGPPHAIPAGDGNAANVRISPSAECFTQRPGATPCGVDFAPDDAATTFAAQAGAPPIAWRVLEGITPYESAVAAMEARVEAIAAGAAAEAVWLLEHPPIYTAGTSAKDADLIDPRFPVYRSGRGGQFTYHGPGQRVAYLMLDLSRRRRDLRAFVHALEDWLIKALADLGVAGERREDRVGVWVRRPDKPCGPGGAAAEDKIAALGLRLRHWVSYHGIALNVAPQLSHFSGITPCGVRSPHFGVTSLEDLGAPSEMAAIDAVLRARFEEIFGPVIDNGGGAALASSP